MFNLGSPFSQPLLKGCNSLSEKEVCPSTFGNYGVGLEVGFAVEENGTGEKKRRRSSCNIQLTFSNPTERIEFDFLLASGRRGEFSF